MQGFDDPAAPDRTSARSGDGPLCGVGFTHVRHLDRARLLTHRPFIPICEMSKTTLEKEDFFRWDGDTLVLNVLGTPNAKRDGIGSVKGHQLGVSVTATPVRGRATDHMVNFLALQFGVSPKQITVVFGRYNVNKQLRIKAPTILPREVGKYTALPGDA